MIVEMDKKSDEPWNHLTERVCIEKKNKRVDKRRGTGNIVIETNRYMCAFTKKGPKHE